MREVPAKRRGCAAAKRVKRCAALALVLLLSACATSAPTVVADYRSELSPDAQGACASVVTVIATYCFPCLGQLEILKSVHADLAPRGLHVEIIAMDLEGAQVVDLFAEQAHLPFPIHPASERFKEGRTPFGSVQALPTTFLLGGAGQKLSAFEGVARPEALKEALNPFLAKEPATDLKRFSCP